MGGLSMFINLPMPIKAAILVVTGGGIMGVLFFLSATGMFGNSLSYLLLAAMVIAGIVFAIYKWIAKKLSKRKAKPFEAKMAESASATPSGVSDPGSRAKLDDLRKRFDEGISVFKEHGKDLYTIPWYVIVGEPGSGKTEAMRHSNVGFPPGLQDQLQGVGGTVNMHWWFTNHAVMIDTAGRLMFDEVAAGSVDEWAEFLKMLRTARPNCPLNGMLLVIPADSLIKDSANDIENKGGKIARQLDNIQRALGVRFPVYIVISKADRINGFREFFEQLTDPVLQMQMLGWTNPTDLDTPFDPSMVEQHLTTVRERLIRRRFSLLADPVNTEDPMGRRIDEVDALYAFPDSLVKLSPRLRRYLEMVFVAGEWSQKPLFLRGIYFTSSMREGDALDADLADVLGVQVDALKEGKLWERDRSYFLKDVFMEKVFREKGLVTRESNVGKSRRRQSMILLSVGTLLALGAGLWTYFAYTRLEKSIETPKREWKPIAEWVAEDLPNAQGSRRNPVLALVRPFSGMYLGNKTRSEKETLTRLDVQKRAWQYAQRRRDGTLKTDPIFWFAAATTGSVFDKMVKAQQFLFDRYALRAFVDEARWRMGNPVDADHVGEKDSSERGASWWSRDAVAALATLLEIESVGLGSEESYTEEDYLRWVRTLGFYPDLSETERRRFRAPDDEYASGWDKFSEEDQRFLAKVMLESFGTDGKGKGGHPSIARTLGVDDEQSIEAVVAGANSFIKSWQAGGGGGEGLLGLLEQFAELGRSYQQAEDRVIRFSGFRDAQTSAEFIEARSEWVGLVEELGDVKKELDELLAKEVQADASEPTKVKFLEALANTPSRTLQTNAERLATDEVKQVFDLVMGSIPDSVSEEDEGRSAVLAKVRKDFSDRRQAYLEELKTSVETAIAAISSEDSGQLTELVKIDANREQPAYAVWYEALVKTSDRIQEEMESNPDVFTFAGVLKDLERELDPVRIDSSSIDEGGRASDVTSACEQALDAYAGYYRSSWVRSVLSDLAGTQLATLVENRSEAAAPDERGAEFDVDLPWLNPKSASLDRKYDEVIAVSVLRSISELGQQVQDVPDAHGPRMLDRDQVEQDWAGVGKALSEYRSAYEAYWKTEVPKKYRPAFAIGGDQAWPAAFQILNDMDETRVFEALYEVTRRTREALAGITTETGDTATATLANALAEDEQGLLRGAGSSSLRGRASVMVQTWKRLTSDLETARTRLLNELDPDNLSEETIRTRYFADIGDTLTPARQYWSGVASVMLSAMSSSLGNEESVKRDALLSIGGRFPLAIDSMDALSVTDFERTRELVRWLASRVASTAGQGARVRVISGLPAEVSEALGKVQGGTGLGASQRRLVNDLVPVLKALEGISELKISLSDPSENLAFVETHKFVRVMQGEKPIEINGRTENRAMGTYRADRAQRKELIALPVPAKGDPIEFRFWATQIDYESGKPPSAVGVLPFPWHGLQAIRNGKQSGKGWLLPLEMVSGSGVYQVLIEGLGDVDSKDWPTVEDWNKAKN